MEDDQQIDTFSFKWDNHERKLIQKFYTFLQSGTLIDCTLKAEGKALKVHKVVLSAYSPYFEYFFRNHYDYDKHIILTLKNIKFKELETIIDLMYRGKIHISRDELTTLLKVAEFLQIKGLSENLTTGSTESRLQNTVSQSTATSLDIHVSDLMIERNNVPRQTLEMSIDLPQRSIEDSASPQVSRGLSSREDSQNPTSRKRKRSLTEDSTVENQDASNSNDMPQQMGVPALGIMPVAEENVHADSTDSLGRSALMTQLKSRPVDEMVQLPLVNPEPNDNLIETRSEHQEEGVKDLMLDEDMNDLNDMEQDNNRAGPSHDPALHPAGGVVDSVTGVPGATNEVFLGAQASDNESWTNSKLAKLKKGCKFICDKCEFKCIELRNMRFHEKHDCCRFKKCPTCGKNIPGTQFRSHKHSCQRKHSLGTPS